MSYPADPYWANVWYLVHFDGAHGNKRIADEKNRFSGAPGTTCILSSTQKKFGNTSLYMDGTSTGTLPSTMSMPGATEYTIEWWVMPLTQTVAVPVLFNIGIDVKYSITGYAGKVLIYIAGVLALVSTNTFATDQWYHMAFTKSGSNVSLFVNGLLEASGVNASGIDASGSLGIGNMIGGANYFRGYLADFRYTYNVNRYPTNFTPPTAAFPHSGVVDPYYDKVQAHLHFNGENGSGTFTDQKGHPFSRIPGTAGQVPSIEVYSSAKFGVSWGDFTTASKGIVATSSDFTLGASDFTIEFYSYTSSYDAYPNMSLFHAIASDGTTDAIRITQTPYSGDIKVSVMGTLVLTASGAGIGALNHIALVRSGAGLRLYANGAQIGTAYNIGTTEITGNGTIGIGGTPFGNMDEFRLTIGRARYLSNFTVPTEPFPDAGPNFLSGTVLDYNNAPLARTVRAFRRSDSLLTDTTVSNASTGAYELRATDMSEHYVVVFDDARNAMVYDHIEPVV